MSVNRRTMAASPAQVWSVLADGWLYPSWVVGASRMREVDDDWPAAGASLHHSVGCWPMLLDDETVVEESHPESLLRLQAGAWPTGRAGVTLRLEPDGGHTVVTIEESPIAGPARLVPGPVLAPSLVWRNTETLRRLAYIAERRP